MPTIDVFPAQQGFPRPPDGGVLVPTTIDFTNISKQAFKPAPLVNPFPIEPTAPATPFLPASQGVPPIPSQSVIVPQALEINLMQDTTQENTGPTYVISDAGSFDINPGTAIKYYTIVSVVDNETGLPASASSVNLKIVITGGALLGSYGFTFAGRSLYFVTPPQTTPPTVPKRTISVFGDVSGKSVVIVPNLDPDGKNPLMSLPNPPIPGGTVAVDTARLDSEVVFQQTGVVQNVVPNTIPHFPNEQVLGPLIPEPGEVDTLIAVQEVDVSNQETVVGTPANYFPGIKL
jgi:hypothetical protein